MFLELRRVHPDVQLTSDASSKWGCGAFCDRRWFQLQWQESLQQMHITINELIPIVLPREWSGLTVQVRCDSAAVEEREYMYLQRRLKLWAGGRAQLIYYT